MKKHISLIMAVVLLFSLSACSATSPQGNEPEKVVNDAFSALQTYDAETLTRCFGVDILGSDVMPRSLSIVYKAAFTKMDYEILDSTVDGENATVTVKVTVVDMDTITLAIKNDMAETMSASGEVYDIVPPMESYQPYLDDPEVATRTETITVPLILKDGVWLIVYDESYFSVLFGVEGLV